MYAVAVEGLALIVPWVNSPSVPHKKNKQKKKKTAPFCSYFIQTFGKTQIRNCNIYNYIDIKNVYKNKMNIKK